MYPLKPELHPTVVIDSRLVRYLPEYLSWEHAQETINHHNLMWVPRSTAESTLDLTQLIPSAIITTQHHQYHTFKRCSSDFEQLSDKLSIIIGGHCDFDDIQPHNCVDVTPQQLHTWAQKFDQVFQRAVARELMEEVAYSIYTTGSNAPPPDIQPLAVVRDRSTPKTAQHMALIYPITCHRRLYALAPEEFETDVQNNGILHHISELQRNSANLDPWTRIIANHISRPPITQNPDRPPSHAGQ